MPTICLWIGVPGTPCRCWGRIMIRPYGQCDRSGGGAIRFR